MDLWWFLNRMECFPNCSCEPMYTGCILCQPVAMLTSIAYLLTAYSLYYWQKKKNNTIFRGWGSLLILVGVSSLFAHSNYTKLGMALDFASITYLQTFFLFYRFKNVGVMGKIPSVVKYPSYFLILLFIYLPLESWPQFYVCLALFTMAAIDFLVQKNLTVLLHKSLIISFTMLGLSTILMLADNWFCTVPYFPYGHSLWHLGSAISAYYFGRWYFLEQEHADEEPSPVPFRK